MKTIVTTDEGAEAARAVYHGTSEVIEFDDADKAAMVMVRLNKTSPWSGEQGAIAAALKRVAPNATIIVCDEGTTLEMLDESRMRALGWVRRKS